MKIFNKDKTINHCYDLNYVVHRDFFIKIIRSVSGIARAVFTSILRGFWSPDAALM